VALKMYAPGSVVELFLFSKISSLQSGLHLEFGLKSDDGHD